MDETIRLAELGLLSQDELAAIAESTSEAKLRVGTDRERKSGAPSDPDAVGRPVSLDERAVALSEAVRGGEG